MVNGYLVVTLDVNDVERMAGFYASALHYVPKGTNGPYTALEDPDGRGPRLLLQVVPEPKGPKNRMHLDVHVADPGAECDRLVALGATVVERQHQGTFGWIVLRDPEGNEFCLVPISSLMS